MKQIGIRMVALLLGALALVASHRTRPAGMMATAANNFLASLNADQRARVTFSFSDEERLNWHFVPRARKGVPLKELDASQRQLANAFLSAGLGQRGYGKAATVMSLEEILRLSEKDTTGRRDSDLYFFSVFGEPSESGTWGWRVEGHHLSLNFTLIKGQTIASTPTFYGANPAEVRHGPRQGLRALAREEDLGRELLRSLDAKQKTLAVVDPTAPKDILTYNSRKAQLAESKGIPAAKLAKKQVDLLLDLIDEYAANMPEELARARLEAARKAGLEKILFAWAGGPDRGQGHYYRIQGPTFLVEYDNTQNDANHIHSVWRDFNGDFGLDLLAAHYQQSHRAAR